MASKLALTAFFFLVLAVGASANKGPQPGPQPKGYHVRVAYKDGERVSTPGYPTNVTSYRTFAGSVYDWKTSKFLGFADGVATVLKVGSDYTIFDLRFTYVYPGVGTFAVAGISDTSLAVNSQAITGGTGQFAKASGYLIAKPVLKFKFPDSASELDITFYF